MAAGLAFGAGSHFPSVAAPVVQLQTRRTKAQKHSGFSFSTGRWNYPAHDGWSVATGKRMAKKRRNQAKNKQRTKGK